MLNQTLNDRQHLVDGRDEVGEETVVDRLGEGVAGIRCLLAGLWVGGERREERGGMCELWTHSVLT